MSHEEAAEFLVSLKRLRDGMDEFTGKVVTLNGAGMRLAALCEKTAIACPAGAAALVQGLTGVAGSLRSFSGTIGDALPAFLGAADGIARGMRLLEIEARRGKH